MPIGTAFHERTFRALREPELPRVVGLLHRQRLREPPRARVQRHPQRRRADRRLAAVQVPGHRAGRGASRRPDHHARRVEDGRRPGVLHAVVRRARQGDRRRDGVAARRRHVPLDRRRSEPALVPPERRRHEGRRSTTCRRGRRAGAAGPDLGARCCAPSPRPTSIALKYFRVTQRHDRRRAGRHLAHRLHRRSRLRDLDAGGRAPSTCGTR